MSADDRLLIPLEVAPFGRPPAETITDLSGLAFGTGWSVRAVLPPALEADTVRAAIEAELAVVGAVFSQWDPRSEVSRFNGAPPGFYRLSDEFWSVLDKSMDLADMTNGAVDPTLGALTDLWGFGPPGPRDAPPDADQITQALALAGWGGLRMQRPHQAVQQVGGMKLDFAGIAKGRAVDRVGARLLDLGVEHWLVEIGGELRGAGAKPDGSPWWVELEGPPGAPGPRTLIALSGLAVATSGDWIRRFEHDGRAYAHTLDGRTGRPVETGVACVSVIDGEAMRADALATAILVLGEAEGLALAEDLGLAFRMLVRGADGLLERVSSRFTAMAEDGADAAS